MNEAGRVFSPFDHPHWQGLLEQKGISEAFTPAAEIKAMLRFEAALAAAEAKVGIIPEAAATAIGEAVSTFRPDGAALQAGIARDGLVVPALIQELRANLDDVHRPHLHVGATSQDVIDTGLILRLKPALASMRKEIESLVTMFDGLGDRHGDTPLVARTRMQRALEIRAADRIGIWSGPLVRHVEALDTLEEDLLQVQFGGPVGTLDDLGEHGPRVRALLAEELGLGDPGGSWHSERGRIADLAGWLSKVSGSLGKIGQDVLLMAQNEIGEAVIAGGGRSSAMAHKRNPVPAELLVTLARYNAGMLGTLHQALVHEHERSGSAWTLEWLTLPQMIAATGAALSIAGRMLTDLELFPNDVPNG